MGRMKTIIIIILVLVIIGFYFAPSLTRNALSTTGHATVNIAKWGYNEIKDNDEVKDTIKNVTEKIKN